MNLEHNIAFIVEMDKLKSIYRQALVQHDQNRFENSAEHSWHAMMTAYTLQNYFEKLSFELNKALKMLLIHDIVEIDAGDTFVYDSNEILSQQKKKEIMAAERIFNIPDKAIGQEFFSLWHEFHENKTDTSKFSNAIDKITPFILNVSNNGGTWKNHMICANKIRQRNENLATLAPKLWTYLNAEINKAINQGWLTE